MVADDVRGPLALGGTSTIRSKSHARALITPTARTDPSQVQAEAVTNTGELVGGPKVGEGFSPTLVEAAISAIDRGIPKEGAFKGEPNGAADEEEAEEASEEEVVGA